MTAAIVAVVLGVALVVVGSLGLHWRRLALAVAEAPAVELSAAVDDQVAGDAASLNALVELERFRSVVDRLQRAVVFWDADGREVYRNEAARAMFAARDGQVLVAAAIEEVMADALAGRSIRREVELFGPPAASFVVVARPFGPVSNHGGGTVDGQDADAGTSGAAMSGAGIDGAVAIVEDRSLQRRIETVRRDFVANISHELKTPIGALGLLAETVRGEPDLDVVERLADRMILEADRVGHTVDDLLELSRIEFGDDTEVEDLDVRSIIGEAESRLGSAPAHAGTRIRIDVAGDLVVTGDRRQLVSAVFNLLDNAVKYSPEGSEIVVGAELDATGTAHEGGRVRLSVTDSGVGVPRRDLDRIFERFYRVDPARSRRTGGTGLGLAIVRHVASNHGGEVLVESTEGVGSVFTLVLGRTERSRPSATNPPNPPGSQEQP